MLGVCSPARWKDGRRKEEKTDVVNISNKLTSNRRATFIAADILAALPVLFSAGQPGVDAMYDGRGVACVAWALLK